MIKTEPMWAAYTRKPYAIYGEIKQNKKVLICNRFRLQVRLYGVTLQNEADSYAHVKKI